MDAAGLADVSALEAGSLGELQLEVEDLVGNGRAVVDGQILLDLGHELGRDDLVRVGELSLIKDHGELVVRLVAVAVDLELAVGILDHDRQRVDGFVVGDTGQGLLGLLHLEGVGAGHRELDLVEDALDSLAGRAGRDRDLDGGNIREDVAGQIGIGAQGEGEGLVDDRRLAGNGLLDLRLELGGLGLVLVVEDREFAVVHVVAVAVDDAVALQLVVMVDHLNGDRPDRRVVDDALGVLRDLGQLEHVGAGLREGDLVEGGDVGDLAGLDDDLRGADRAAVDAAGLADVGALEAGSADELQLELEGLVDDGRAVVNGQILLDLGHELGRDDLVRVGEGCQLGAVDHTGRGVELAVDRQFTLDVRDHHGERVDLFVVGDAGQRLLDLVHGEGVGAGLREVDRIEDAFHRLIGRAGRDRDAHARIGRQRRAGRVGTVSLDLEGEGLVDNRRLAGDGLLDLRLVIGGFGRVAVGELSQVAFLAVVTDVAVTYDIQRAAVIADLYRQRPAVSVVLVVAVRTRQFLHSEGVDTCGGEGDRVEADFTLVDYGDDRRRRQSRARGIARVRGQFELEGLLVVVGSGLADHDLPDLRVVVRGIRRVGVGELSRRGVGALVRLIDVGHRLDGQVAGNVLHDHGRVPGGAVVADLVVAARRLNDLEDVGASLGELDAVEGDRAVAVVHIGAGDRDARHRGQLVAVRRSGDIAQHELEGRVVGIGQRLAGQDLLGLQRLLSGHGDVVVDKLSQFADLLVVADVGVSLGQLAMVINHRDRQRPGRTVIGEALGVGARVLLDREDVDAGLLEGDLVEGHAAGRLAGMDRHGFLPGLAGRDRGVFGLESAVRDHGLRSHGEGELSILNQRFAGHGLLRLRRILRGQRRVSVGELRSRRLGRIALDVVVGLDLEIAVDVFDNDRKRPGRSVVAEVLGVAARVLHDREDVGAGLLEGDLVEEHTAGGLARVDEHGLGPGLAGRDRGVFRLEGAVCDNGLRGHGKGKLGIVHQRLAGHGLLRLGLVLDRGRRVLVRELGDLARHLVVAHVIMALDLELAVVVFHNHGQRPGVLVILVVLVVALRLLDGEDVGARRGEVDVVEAGRALVLDRDARSGGQGRADRIVRIRGQREGKGLLAVLGSGLADDDLLDLGRVVGGLEIVRVGEALVIKGGVRVADVGDELLLILVPGDHDGHGPLEVGIVLPAGGQRIGNDFLDLEGVGARAVQRQLRELLLRAGFAVGLAGDRDRDGLDRIAVEELLVQLFQSLRRDGIQSQLKVEVVGAGGRALEDLLHLELDGHAADVLDHDLIGRGDLAGGRELQREAAGIARGGDLRAGSRDGLGNDAVLVVAGSRVGLLDHVLLPPVETGDQDLAFVIGDELGDRTGRIQRVDAVLELELQRAAGGGSAGVLLEGTVELELGALDHDLIVIRRDLQDLQFTEHHEADVLALVDDRHVRDEERAGPVVRGGRSGVGIVEVVVQGVRVGSVEAVAVDRIGHVVLGAERGELEDLAQIAVLRIVDQTRAKVVVVRIGTLQSQRVQLFVDVQVAGDQNLRGAETLKAEVLDGLVLDQRGIDARAGVVHEGRVHAFAAAVVLRVELNALSQQLDDRIVGVIAVVGRALDAVLILVDPDVALDLDQLVKQSDGDRVGSGVVLAVVLEGDVELVVGVREGVVIVEVRVIGDVHDVGAEGQEHRRVLRQMDRLVEDHDESCHALHRVPGGVAGVEVVVRIGNREAARRSPAAAGQIRRIGDGVLHRGVRGGDGTGVVVHRVLRGVDVDHVVHRAGDHEHVVVPERAHGIADLRNNVADHDLVDVVLLRVAVGDGETPIHGALVLVVDGVLVGAGRHADAGLMEAVVLVAADRLGQRHGGHVADFDVGGRAEPRITLTGQVAQTVIAVQRSLTGRSGAAAVDSLFGHRHAEGAVVVREGVTVGIVRREVALVGGGQVCVVLELRAGEVGRGKRDLGREEDRHGGAALQRSVQTEGDRRLRFADFLTLVGDHAGPALGRGRLVAGEGLARRTGADDLAALHVIDGGGQDIGDDRIVEVDVRRLVGDLQPVDHIGHAGRVEVDDRVHGPLHDLQLGQLDRLHLDDSAGLGGIAAVRPAGAVLVPHRVSKLRAGIVLDLRDGIDADAELAVRLLRDSHVDLRGLHAELLAQAVLVVKAVPRAGMVDNGLAVVEDLEVLGLGRDARDRHVAADVFDLSRADGLGVLLQRVVVLDDRRDLGLFKIGEEPRVDLVRSRTDFDLREGVLHLNRRRRKGQTVFRHVELREHLVPAGHLRIDRIDQMAVAGKQGLDLAVSDVVLGVSLRALLHSLGQFHLGIAVDVLQTDGIDRIGIRVGDRGDHLEPGDARIVAAERVVLAAGGLADLRLNDEVGLGRIPTLGRFVRSPEGVGAVLQDAGIVELRVTGDDEGRALAALGVRSDELLDPLAGQRIGSVGRQLVDVVPHLRMHAVALRLALVAADVGLLNARADVRDVVGHKLDQSVDCAEDVDLDLLAVDRDRAGRQLDVVLVNAVQSGEAVQVEVDLSDGIDVARDDQEVNNAFLVLVLDPGAFLKHPVVPDFMVEGELGVRGLGQMHGRRAVDVVELGDADVVALAVGHLQSGRGVVVLGGQGHLNIAGRVAVFIHGQQEAFGRLCLVDAVIGILRSVQRDDRDVLAGDLRVRKDGGAGNLDPLAFHQMADLKLSAFQLGRRILHVVLDQVGAAVEQVVLHGDLHVVRGIDRDRDQAVLGDIDLFAVDQDGADQELVLAVDLRAVDDLLEIVGLADDQHGVIVAGLEVLEAGLGLRQFKGGNGVRVRIRGVRRGLPELESHGPARIITDELVEENFLLALDLDLRAVLRGDVHRGVGGADRISIDRPGAARVGLDRRGRRREAHVDGQTAGGDRSVEDVLAVDVLDDAVRVAGVELVEHEHAGITAVEHDQAARVGRPGRIPVVLQLRPAVAGKGRRHRAGGGGREGSLGDAEALAAGSAGKGLVEDVELRALDLGAGLAFLDLGQLDVHEARVLDRQLKGGAAVDQRGRGDFRDDSLTVVFIADRGPGIANKRAAIDQIGHEARILGGQILLQICAGVSGNSLSQDVTVSGDLREDILAVPLLRRRQRIEFKGCAGQRIPVHILLDDLHFQHARVVDRQVDTGLGDRKDTGIRLVRVSLLVIFGPTAEVGLPNAVGTGGQAVRETEDAAGLGLEGRLFSGALNVIIVVPILPIGTDQLLNAHLNAMLTHAPDLLIRKAIENVLSRVDGIAVRQIAILVQDDHRVVHREVNDAQRGLAIAVGDRPVLRGSAVDKVRGAHLVLSQGVDILGARHEVSVVEDPGRAGIALEDIDKAQIHRHRRGVVAEALGRGDLDQVSQDPVAVEGVDFAVN